MMRWGAEDGMVSLHQIEVFRALMVAKTVTAAAAIMNISQPALSRIIKRMEDRVGFPLFERVKGRLVATPEAIALYADVEIIHKKVADLNLTIERLASGEGGIFRFGASPSLGNSVVPIALKKLRSRHPRLVVHADIVPLDQLIDYLTLRKGEIVLTLFPIEHPMIRNQRIGVGRMVCAFAQDHSFADLEHVTAQELAEEDIIGFQAESSHANVIRSVEQSAGVSFRFKTFVRFAETALALAEQGLGVALIDEFTAMGAHNGAQTIRHVAEAARFTLYANSNLYGPPSAHGKAFIRALRQVVPQSL
jgi:DNA-binding transcriptional LysR family regulator